MLNQSIINLGQRLIREKNNPFERYFDFSFWDSGKHFMLLGPRGIGKTTLLAQYLTKLETTLSPEEILYVQADHIGLGDFTLFGLAEEFYNHGGRLLVIDEVHKYYKWSKELKSIVDTFSKLKLICSGSSILDLLKGTHDLSRRIHLCHLNGFSFREFINLKCQLDLKPIAFSEILSQHSKLSTKILTQLKENRILALFQDYIRRGYYPFSFETNSLQLFQGSLENTIRLTIEVDIPNAYPEMTEVSIHKILKLLKFIARNVPYEPDLKKLKELVEIGDERTLKHYLKMLEQSGVIRLLYTSNKGMKALAKPDKIYLDNPNLFFALNPTLDKEAIGSIRESFFMSMVSSKHVVLYNKLGDFLVDNKHTFEIGGKNKSTKQINNLSSAYIGMDDIETGSRNTIPLWLFGFLY